MFRRFAIAGCLLAVSSVVGASPASASLATDWTTVSAGGGHTCAIRAVGKLYCWGNDVNDQVGNGAPTGDVTSPVQITSATDWKTVSAGGNHTCAFRSVRNV
jgi:alpha-tubulin suppressor-like RCC1 family protein